MAPESLHLILENTGSDMILPRSLAEDDTVTALKDVIRRARTAGGKAVLPNDSRYTLYIQRECSGAAEFALFGPLKPRGLFRRGEVMLVHCLVAWTENGEKRAVEWTGELPQEPGNTASLANGALPCCVTRYHSTDALAAARWLGDAQMCFAWAWIEGA